MILIQSLLQVGLELLVVVQVDACKPECWILWQFLVILWLVWCQPNALPLIAALQPGTVGRSFITGMSKQVDDYAVCEPSYFQWRVSPMTTLLSVVGLRASSTSFGSN